jgi:ATP-dependent RNA helicase MSS116
VFFNTARVAGFMAQLILQAKYNVLEMHSRKSQSARVSTTKQFRSQNNVTFSSDVSAGVEDYPDVSLIVQIGLTEREQYIHRLGRTAREGKTGKGLLILYDFKQNGHQTTQQ